MVEIIAKLEDFRLEKQPAQSGVIQCLGIVGCGSMGQEIVKTLSQYGFDVVFLDISEQKVEEALKGITNLLDNEINHWGMTNGEKRLILSRITGTTQYKDLSDCDIVIEAIHSRKAGTSLATRKEIFLNIEKYVRRDAIIASNTATRMISDLSSGLEFPDRVVGIHFISPTDKIKVVEVVNSAETSIKALDLVCRFVRMIEKEPIRLQESPGNISTRMIVAIINEACTMLMEGLATIESIDKLMKTSYGHQFGPFEMADRIGLDKVQKWMDNLFTEFGEHQYKASPVIKRLVRANHLGKAVGKGFYKYDEKGKIMGSTITCPEVK